MTRDTAERARELHDEIANYLNGLIRQGMSRYYHADKIMALVAEYETQIQAESRERLAVWMVEHSFSTGHGDTFEDLLKELDWQVKELRGARLEEAKWWHERFANVERYGCCQRITALAQALQPEEKEGIKS